MENRDEKRQIRKGELENIILKFMVLIFLEKDPNVLPDCYPVDSIR